MKLIILATLLGSLLSAPLYSQGLEDVQKRLDAILAKAQEKDRFIGLSILVVDKERGSFKKHYGFRDHARTLAPNDDTMYEIGSITKVFTRLLVSAQDKIKPDDLLAKHLPEGIRVPRPRGEDITIRNLMSHTSGILISVPCVERKSNPGKLKCYGFDFDRNNKDPYGSGTKELTNTYITELSHSMDDFGQAYPGPGVFWQYSNVGIGIVGNLLEDAHGQGLEQLFTKSILAPLGMTRTKLAMPCEKTQSCDNLADTHHMKPDMSGWEPWVPFHMPGIRAAGEMRSSLGDMEKFLRANMYPRSSPISAVLEKGQEALPKVSDRHNGNICKEGQERYKDLCNPVEKTFNGAWFALSTPDVYYHPGRTLASEAVIEIFGEDRKVGIVALHNGGYIAVPTKPFYPGFLSQCILSLMDDQDDPMPDMCKLLIDPPQQPSASPAVEGLGLPVIPKNVPLQSR